VEDLDQLRKTHPLWDAGILWVTVATGPDYCHYVATRQGTTLRAASLRELDRLISAVEVANGWCCTSGGPPVPQV
jgi:hypothetical protein